MITNLNCNCFSSKFISCFFEYFFFQREHCIWMLLHITCKQWCLRIIFWTLIWEMDLAVNCVMHTWRSRGSTWTRICWQTWRTRRCRWTPRIWRKLRWWTGGTCPRRRSAKSVQIQITKKNRNFIFLRMKIPDNSSYSAWKIRNRSVHLVFLFGFTLLALGVDEVGGDDKEHQPVSDVTEHDGEEERHSSDGEWHLLEKKNEKKIEEF